MTIRAVLFDFSGTLFRLEADESWASDLVTADGRPFDEAESAEILDRMTTPVHQAVRFDAHHQQAWEQRDLDPARHREVYREVLRQTGVVGEPAQRLYSRMVDPLLWTPYPDTGKVLEALSGNGIQVAVVSNIPFDIRPAFRAHEWDRYIDLYALSFELGAIKPDRPIFEWTLERLGVAAQDALMVGDSRENDGAATEVGCAYEWVDPAPTVDRRTGLLDALARHNLL
ncbi:HAD family hydrolase [Nocardia macrotermitis]|uniref:Phosphoglycolate phosphatase n=1 Tax=Nocardia macrotermitis TaxID=2585198 RepID=A0A7K0D661_9NOCA|nr:HAD family hydrolase [Nocardia macrotermitis]MQY21041.1 Phosphoglycolate phosphatase [Nocardia macrotermitis]